MMQANTTYPTSVSSKSSLLHSPIKRHNQHHQDVIVPMQLESASPLPTSSESDKEGFYNNTNTQKAKQNLSVARNNDNEKYDKSAKNPSSKAWKKPAGKPKRPLSAYNYFFQHHRTIVISSLPEKKENERADIEHLFALPASTATTSEGKPKRKRRSRGIGLGFAHLARNVAETWKKLESGDRKPYEEMAKRDKKRYEREMDAWSAALGGEQTPQLSDPNLEATKSKREKEDLLKLQYRYQGHGTSGMLWQQQGFTHYRSQQQQQQEQKSPPHVRHQQQEQKSPPHVRHQQQELRHCHYVSGASSNESVAMFGTRHRSNPQASHHQPTRNEKAVRQPVTEWAVRTPIHRRWSDSPSPKHGQSQPSFLSSSQEHEWYDIESECQVTLSSISTPEQKQREQGSTFEEKDVYQVSNDSLHLDEDLSLWANGFMATNNSSTPIFESPLKAPVRYTRASTMSCIPTALIEESLTQDDDEQNQFQKSTKQRQNRDIDDGHDTLSPCKLPVSWIF